MFSVVYVLPQLYTCLVSFSRRSACMSPCFDRCENGLATLGREDGRVQGGGGVLRIGKPKAVGSTHFYLHFFSFFFIFSLFLLFFLVSLNHFIYLRKFEHRKMH